MATNGVPVSETSPLLAGPSRSDEEAIATPEQDETRQAQLKGNEQAKPNLKWIILSMSVGVALAAIDQSIIVASYGKIGSDLEALNLTSWIATSYFLALSSFQPLYGKLSDIYGRRPCILFAYVVFGTGCVLCGIATNIKQLIVARIWQGIGGAGMTTVVSIVMSDLVPLRERGVYQGIINIIYAGAAATGAPLGGFLADTVGWRCSFLVQGPMCLVGVIFVKKWLILPPIEDSHWKEKLRRIDFRGAFMLVIAVFSLLIGTDRGSNLSWTAPITLSALGAALVFAIAFFYIEIRVASEPFAPGHIIFSKVLLPCYIVNFFGFASWLAALFFLPLYFQATQGHTASQAGLRVLPAALASVCGSLGSGVYMKKTGRYYRITLLSAVMLTLALLTLYLSSGPLVTNNWIVVLATMPAAFGVGIAVTTTLIGLISNATPQDQAVVTACSYLFRTLGSIIGIALTSTLVQQYLRVHLAKAIGDGHNVDEIVEQIRQSLDYIEHLDPTMRTTVRACYGKAVNLGFGSTISLALIELLAAIFIKEQHLGH